MEKETLELDEGAVKEEGVRDTDVVQPQPNEDGKKNQLG